MINSTRVHTEIFNEDEYVRVFSPEQLEPVFFTNVNILNVFLVLCHIFFNLKSL